jgi:hypothetical protein
LSFGLVKHTLSCLSARSQNQKPQSGVLLFPKTPVAASADMVPFFERNFIMDRATMTTEKKIGIAGKLKLMGARVEQWPGGCKFTLGFSNDVSRAFNFNFADRGWTEVSKGTPRPVSEKALIEYLGLRSNPNLAS